MDENSNISEVEAWFDDLFDDFGFTTPTADGKTLGEACAELVAESIAASDAADPDGTPWPDNSEPYRSRKLRKYGVDTTGYRTGQMLSVESLKGVPQVSRDEVVMPYGIGQPASGSPIGSWFDPKSDGRVTDRQKGEWFTEKVGEFYALNEERSDAVADLVRSEFAEHSERKAARGT